MGKRGKKTYLSRLRPSPKMRRGQIRQRASVPAILADLDDLGSVGVLGRYGGELFPMCMYHPSAWECKRGGEGGGRKRENGGEKGRGRGLVEEKRRQLTPPPP